MSDQAVRDANGLRLLDYDDTVTASWASLEHWASAWVVENQSTEKGLGPAHDFEWLLGHERPDWYLEAVLTLVAVAGPEDLVMVGVGPLEDFIRSGPIDQELLGVIEDQVHRSAPFRTALSNVWLGEGVPEVARKRLAELGARDLIAEQAMTADQRAAYVVDRDARGLGWG